ncbi:helicase-exonuclease AddAB subunit AddB [Mobilitalea sibirica]|uniref:Helicase-exonuclease AddAB subunit AddB n=1 Tax=Mobilitalea sibirica TaxID=1462919 RepID=A0A8J7L309_9FIRM|nr:helicase-exonuclease AddAB subunit AddB [Mobilitalea sibirica]MBH1941558.1 helicase-exonuclease AddAB subunit AddB [Mobilitalea sibirica]
MSLQLFLGSAGSGKSYQLYREVIEQSKINTETNYLVIVPEQFTLQTQKDIVAMHPDHGVMNVDILSFLRFAYRIFDEIGGEEYPILEDTGKSMVIRKVVAEKKKDLVLFGSNVHKLGFINELKSLLSEFYQYNIGPEDFDKLMEISEKKTLLKAKLHDILTIYEGFKTYMKERYITAEEVLVVLNKVIDRSEWLRNSVICLDGFTGFTPCQYKLLEKMMAYAKKVMVTVTIDPRETLEGKALEHQIFSLSKKTITKLYHIAKENDIPIEYPVYADARSDSKVPYRFLRSPALASLEHNLFRYPYESYEDEQDEISIHATKDTEMEVSYVIREIKTLIREKGYRYQDIAVVTGDIETYGRIAKRMFLQAGMPCFIDYKKKILGNPFAELLRSSIAIVAEDYSYESVFRYLRTGLSELIEEEIDLLENYILATGIRGSKRYLENFSRAYRSKEPIDLERINAIRAKLVKEIQPLYEVLKDRDLTCKDYTTALYELGIRLDIERKLLVYREEFNNTNQPLLAKEYEQIYRIVIELYDQIVLLLGSEHLTLKEFGEIIETGLVEATVGLIPPGVDEIVVGDTQRTRLKDIKVLFFIGVNEGMIPKAIGSGGILSDSERELLCSHEIELAPTKRQQAFTEQFYIYLNMTKPKDRLYITYHKVNGEGKSVNPSFLIGKLKSLFPKIKIINEDETKEDLEYILRDDGISYLAHGLREDHGNKVSDLWKELFLYYRQGEETNRMLHKLMQGAFYINKENGISKEAARLLYGEELKGSVTRLERYAGCAFAHFMTYGLSLEERREYKLAVPDIGNIFHNAIDAFSKRISLSEYTWHTIPEEVRTAWAIESVAKAVEDYENSFLKSNKRNEYIIKRIERITIRTLWALCNQIKQGAFEPMAYEMAFYHIPDPIMALTGRIDRLDLYEEDDKVYVRVIDYKSGNTTFDIGSVYYGLQQQLAVYLSAAIEYLKKKYQDKEIVPSGIFYYHIDDPIVAKSEQAEDEIFKSLKMNGLINEDKQIIGLMDQKLAGPDGGLRASVKSDIIQVETNKEGELNKRSATVKKEQLSSLASYVNQKLVEDGKQILEGDTRLNPYRMGNRTACDYCEYKSACGFDLRLPGHAYRNLEKKSVEEIKAEIWGDEQ